MASNRLDLPALLAPTSTVSSLRFTSIFESERKSETRTWTNRTPDFPSVPGAGAGATPPTVVGAGVGFGVALAVGVAVGLELGFGTHVVLATRPQNVVSDRSNKSLNLLRELTRAPPASDTGQARQHCPYAVSQNTRSGEVPARTEPPNSASMAVQGPTPQRPSVGLGGRSSAGFAHGEGPNRERVQELHRRRLRRNRIQESVARRLMRSLVSSVQSRRGHIRLPTRSDAGGMALTGTQRNLLFAPPAAHPNEIWRHAARLSKRREVLSFPWFLIGRNAEI